VTVTRPGYWQIRMDKIQANGRTMMSGLDVIIDTGANYIYGDKINVYRLNKALGGKPVPPNYSYYSLPCHANPEPSVTFTFGGRPFSLPIETLRLEPISEGSPDCLSAIMPRAAYSFWSIGSPFLQGVYTVFDHGTGPQPTPRVGFAELA